MAESTITLTWTEFKVEVADFLGYTRTSANWSTDQTARIEACVNHGVRQFYQPHALPEQIGTHEPAHEWSFIKPWTTLATTADDADQDAPDNFASLASQLFYSSTDRHDPIEIVSPSIILEHRRTTTGTGPPFLAATRSKTTDGSSGQRWEFMFYRTPNSAYTLSYQYYVIQGALGDSYPYPLGGGQHSMTIMASCLDYAAAMYRPDQSTSMRTLYNDRLRASISLDLQTGWRTLLENADPSIRRGLGRRLTVSYCTLEGVAVT